MKLVFRNITILSFFLTVNYLSAQFNTLVHTTTTAKKENNYFEEAKKNEIKENDEKKESKVKKRPLRLNSKAELKREVDSLKMMLIKYGLTKKQNNFDYKKVEDSVLKIIDEKIQFATAKNTRIKTLDRIEETPSYIQKIYMPLDNNLQITSKFGIRIHPILRTTKMHNGVDLAANFEPIRSVLDGVVSETGWDSKGGGNYIKILHSGKFETSFLHLSQIYYKTGEFVKGGWIIGKSGNSGNSTGAHLHFSVKEYGKYINPIHFLNDLVQANNLIALYNGK